VGRAAALASGLELGAQNVLVKRDGATGAQQWALPLPSPAVAAFLASGVDVPLRQAPNQALSLPAAPDAGAPRGVTGPPWAQHAVGRPLSAALQLRGVAAVGSGAGMAAHALRELQCLPSTAQPLQSVRHHLLVSLCFSLG
jgi:hypothetical protein